VKPVRLALAAAAAVALLWLPFVPTLDLAQNGLVADWHPPAALLLALAAVAVVTLAGGRLGRGGRGTLAAVLLGTALLQLAAALVPRFLDRALDLYFDLPQVPSLMGIVTDAVGATRAASGACVAAAGLVALLALLAWALGVVERVLATHRVATAVLALSLALLVGSAVSHSTLVSFAAPAAIGDQAARLWRAETVIYGYDHRYDAALDAPAPAETDLAALKGHDVFLVFVESYGTVVLDEPRYREAIEPALAAFAAATRTAGYGLVSARLTSPVFGGGSWLAHATLASGLKLDPFLYRLLTTSARLSLPRYLQAAEHRTVAVMPGIKKPWPEGDFFGYDRGYYAADLGYDGPPFGWFRIPDQFTLARLDQWELAPGHKPLFAEIVLVSSHTPFAPVPPYVADWADAGPYKSVSEADWRRIYLEPDWGHLDRPYLDSIAYDLRTLAAWLARLDGAPLVIILGDHQPPGMVPSNAAPWTVPVHVLSRDPALLAPFVRAGYRPGAAPPADGLVKGMETFLGDFLAGFSRGGHAGF